MSNFDDLEKYIADYAKAFEVELEEVLNIEADGQLATLIDAMKYSVFSGGKRLRPFLLTTFADLLGVSRKASMQYGCAVELIHCYSLVHDDLPALDDDDLRRGRPSCHKKFNEGIAILCGDALLTKAFEVASKVNDLVPANVALEIVHKMAIASGHIGMVGGQIVDISMPRDSELNDILHMERMKTGALFMLCAEIATALSMSVSKKQKDHIYMYARSIGAAFQIADDIKDFHNKKGEINIVTTIGESQARNELNMLIDQAQSTLSIFDEKKALILRKFSDYIMYKI